MKNLFLILCSLLLIISCKSDDDDSQSEIVQNKVTHSGETYPVMGVKLLELNLINGNNSFVKGIINEEQDYGFVIHLYGNTISTIPGNYTVYTGEDYEPDIHCKVVVNLPDSDMEITQGEVNVNIVENIITIEFEVEGIGTEGTVKAYYQGPYIIE